MKNQRQEKKAITTEAKNAQPVEILFLLPPNIEFDDFVNPPSNISTIQKEGKLYGSLITDAPLGVISLSAYIKKFMATNTVCVDFNVELNRAKSFEHDNFYDYFCERLEDILSKSYEPHYIAVSSLFTPAYQSVLDLSKIAKAMFPDALVLAGGNLPTSMYREMLQDSQDLDAVCFGEGELALLGLLNAEDKEDYLEQSTSWATHSILSETLPNLKHDFIWDLDEIPFYDYDMLDIDGYSLNPTSSRYAVSDKYEIDVEDSSVVMEDSKGKEVPSRGNLTPLPIMTSRGCPFKCTFCASHAAHGRAMRYHSLDRVEQDIATLKEKFGIEGVVIQDDHFMADHHKKRPYEIVKSLGKQKLEMFFQNALAIYALDREFLELLEENGVKELVLPVESGSARVLKEEMKKPLQLSKIPEVTKNCREIGIYTDCNIIIGMPGETKKDIDDGRAFLKTIYADWFRIFVATPIPGSEMHQTVVDGKLNSASLLNANYKRAVIETEHLTSEYLQFMTYYMNIELNFVYNSNMRLGRYKTAVESFKNVIRVKPDHAVAHYFASECYLHLNRTDEASRHIDAAQKIVSSTNFWDVFIDDFSLNLVKGEEINHGIKSSLVSGSEIMA